MAGIYYCPIHRFSENSTCSECGEDIDKIMSHSNRKSVSKFMSGVLRHFPDDFDIDIDDNGWVDLDELYSVLSEQYEELELLEVEGIIALDSKGRFELHRNKVRAVYGHSIPVTINKSDGEIPDILYHGTPTENVESIMDEGLQPMSREDVHLTDDLEEAKNIGERHTTGDISILQINAAELEESQDIEKRSSLIYTTDFIDSDYIKVKGLF